MLQRASRRQPQRRCSGGCRQTPHRYSCWLVATAPQLCRSLLQLQPCAAQLEATAAALWRQCCGSRRQRHLQRPFRSCSCRLLPPQCLLQRRAAAVDHSRLPAADAHGKALEAGAWLAPRLTQRSHMASGALPEGDVKSSRPGTVLVTGVPSVHAGAGSARWTIPDSTAGV